MFFQTHNTHSISVGLALGWAVLVGALTLAGESLAQVTERVSVDSNGVQANQDSSFQSAISADGRYVAFESRANNLVPGDTNGSADVFVHDRQTGATERVSVAGDGTEGNQSSGMPSISADGRYVAFQSVASNLVADDTNGAVDAFVHDRLTGATERVSVYSSGNQATGGWAPSISGDGRYVAFVSGDDYLVPDDSNRTIDVFVRDRQTGTIERVSVSTAGVQADLGSTRPKISRNGRYVALLSFATNLVSGDSNGKQDAFVHDRETGKTERVSVATDGAQGYGHTEYASVSDNGRYAAFLYYSDDLVPNDTNGASDVFVRDLVSKTTQRVSVSSDGAQGNRYSHSASLSSFEPEISSNGRYVGFSSWADNLVAGDSNETADVFVHDRLLGKTELVSASTLGDQGNMQSLGPALSGDGRFVAFGSLAGNLVSEDTNAAADVFVRDRGVVDKLVNISTRAFVQTGDNVLIGGFIVSGSSPKTVLIRVRGPSLAQFGVAGAIANPYVELYSGPTKIAQNDNWQTTDPLCGSPATSCGDAAAIQATGLDPCSIATTGCTLDSAILITLPAGPYTAIVRGVGGLTGVANVGVFDVDQSTASKLVNVSSRGLVLAGDSVMIGGFVVGASSGGKTVLVRVRGPSLAASGVAGSIANPRVELYSGPTKIAQNDDWQMTDTLCGAPALSCGNATDIHNTGLGPCSLTSTGCMLDSAILITLPPGPYTAIVRGVGGATGVANVGVFDLSP